MKRQVWLTLQAIPPNVKRLFTSLSFLRLRNRNLLVFQWIVPTAIALFTFMILDKDGGIFVFSYDKIISGVNNLVGVLVGFYIAALAATATFPNSNLDKELSGSPTTLIVKKSGNVTEEKITRRRYMTIIFGYCSFLSISLFVFGLLQTNVKLSPKAFERFGWISESAFQLCWFVYLWLIASLFCATLVGLHYLIDRMHRD